MRYLNWLGEVLQGDLGRSYTYDTPVQELLLNRVELSLLLALLAILLSTGIAIPLGVFAASRHRKVADTSIMGFAQLGVAVPNFWFAILLILLFSGQTRMVQCRRFAGWDGLVSGFQVTCPSCGCSGPSTGCDSSPCDKILGTGDGSGRLHPHCKSKGLSRSQALWRHAVRNALIPVVTILGLQLSFLLAGTIIIENVFYLPGVGRLLFQAIAQRDLMVVKNGSRPFDHCGFD